MNAVLGNFYGTVKPWWLPFDFVLARTVGVNPRTIVTRNKLAPNVWGLPVVIYKGKVIKLLPPKEAQ